MKEIMDYIIQRFGLPPSIYEDLGNTNLDATAEIMNMARYEYSVEKHIVVPPDPEWQTKMETQMPIKKFLMEILKEMGVS